MKVEHLEEFLVLAETRSFAETAKRCHVSQSSLSKHISGLEDECGVDLVEHASSPLVLTKGGKSLASDVRSIVNEYRAAMKHLQEIKQHDARQVVLGYSYPAARWALKPIYANPPRGTARHKVKPVSLSPMAIKSSLLDKTIDAALSLNLDNDLNDVCNSLTIKEEHMLLAVNKDNPLAKFDEVKLVDLEDETFLRPAPQTWPGITKHLESLFSHIEGYRHGVFLDDVESVLLGVMNGAGIAMVLDHNRSIYGDRIRFIKVKEEAETNYVIRLQLMWLKSSEESKNKADSVAYLKKLFASAVL